MKDISPEEIYFLSKCMHVSTHDIQVIIKKRKINKKNV